MVLDVDGLTGDAAEDLAAERIDTVVAATAAWQNATPACGRTGRRDVDRQRHR